MPAEGFSGAAAEWLVTFAIHGTVVLAVVFAVTRAWRMPEPVEEVLWRFALVGGLLTSALQTATGGAPWAAIPIREPLPSTEPFAGTVAAAVSAPERLGDWPEPALEGGVAVLPAADTGVPFRATDGIVMLALALGLVGLGRLGARRAALRRMLADRREVLPGSPAFESLDRLRVRVGFRGRVRLTVCPELDAPVAFGVLRPEICVPKRAMLEMSAASRDAMLAHELAHVVRRDPLWLEFAHTLRAMFPWQPLLAVATRRLRALAEFRCDAVGARLVGAVEVADCLVEVAGWLAERRGLSAAEGLVGMTVYREGLSARVDRLLGAAGGEAGGAPPRFVAFLLGAATVVFATALPGAGTRAPETVPARTAAEPVPDELVAPAETVDPFDELFAAVDVERAALAEEVALLRAEAEPFLPDPELSALLDALDRRLRSLDERRAVLETAVRSFMDAETSADSFPTDWR